MLQRTTVIANALNRLFKSSSKSLQILTRSYIYNKSNEWDPCSSIYHSQPVMNLNWTTEGHRLSGLTRSMAAVHLNSSNMCNSVAMTLQLDSITHHLCSGCSSGWTTFHGWSWERTLQTVLHVIQFISLQSASFLSVTLIRSNSHC